METDRNNNQADRIKDTIKVAGYSEGDRSVGIGMRDFLIDTGLLKLSQDDKDYIIKTLIRDIWELHDNGNLYFDFSDEMIEENFDYMRIFTYKDSEKILKEKNERD